MKTLSLCLLGLLAWATAYLDHPKFRRVQQSRKIHNEYIVVLQIGYTIDDLQVSVFRLGANSTVMNVYGKVVNGFSVRMPESALDTLLNDPVVKSVEENPLLDIDAVQSEVIWSLDRIDQPDQPLDSNYHYEYTGRGVDVYIVDTGIRKTHQEFEGRASCTMDFIEDGGNCEDETGHGTHIAGTVGGKTYGVAKKVNLKALKVCTADGCSGSAILAALDYVAGQNGKRVINASVSVRTWRMANEAAESVVEEGVVMVVSAGNNDEDACGRSFASAQNMIAVGAATSGDERASFSNYGSCVDIFAPGTRIESASTASDSSTTFFDGTSMAAPAVAGVAALHLDMNPDLSVLQVKASILADAVSGRLSNIQAGSPNLLLQKPSHRTISPTVPPTEEPTQRPTSAPTVNLALNPTKLPTMPPTSPPTQSPTSAPTVKPTLNPTKLPTVPPTTPPTQSPMSAPTANPTLNPTKLPTEAPTGPPTQSPTLAPTSVPTLDPTMLPTMAPTGPPTEAPTQPLTKSPIQQPTTTPVDFPTGVPTQPSSNPPTVHQTECYTKDSTELPAQQPSLGRYSCPSESPTKLPTEPPPETSTDQPVQRTDQPVQRPTNLPNVSPTSPLTPSVSPSRASVVPSSEPTTLVARDEPNPGSRAQTPTMVQPKSIAETTASPTDLATDPKTANSTVLSDSSSTQPKSLLMPFITCIALLYLYW